MIDPRDVLALVSDEALVEELDRRRLRPKDDVILTHGGLSLHLMRQEARWRGVRAPLGERECRLLAVMLGQYQRGHDYVSASVLRYELFAGWDPADAGNCLRVMVTKLRRKLPGLIPCSQKRGQYRLNLDAAEVAA